MDTEYFLITERLFIQPLAITDDMFMFELVNTEGWIRFIGNRNIASVDDARVYVQKIVASRNIFYWMVKRRKEGDDIGIITFIKRDFLLYPDIGFAFLPRVAKKGYACEAACAVLHQLIRQQNLSHILATTVPENISSITLLKRMGLAFEKEMEIENETLHVYGAATGNLRNQLQ